jgi:hypothetical protein
MKLGRCASDEVGALISIYFSSGDTEESDTLELRTCRKRLVDIHSRRLLIPAEVSCVMQHHKERPDLAVQDLLDKARHIVTHMIKLTVFIGLCEGRTAS